MKINNISNPITQKTDKTGSDKKLQDNNDNTKDELKSSSAGEADMALKNDLEAMRIIAGGLFGRDIVHNIKYIVENDNGEYDKNPEKGKFEGRGGKGEFSINKETGEIEKAEYIDGSYTGGSMYKYENTGGRRIYTYFDSDTFDESYEKNIYDAQTGQVLNEKFWGNKNSSDLASTLGRIEKPLEARVMAKEISYSDGIAEGIKRDATIWSKIIGESALTGTATAILGGGLGFILGMNPLVTGVIGATAGAAWTVSGKLEGIPMQKVYLELESRKKE